jgi:type 1 glutamine amidotransferase
MKKPFGLFGICALAWLGTVVPAHAAETKIVLIAGRPSHGPGEHEYNAGAKLLVECLEEVPGIDPVFVAGGWPQDEGAFQGAKSVVFFMDGGGRHPMIQGKRRIETMRRLMDEGVGLVCLHYAVEVPKGEAGDQLLDWLGGYYEAQYSDNPHNTADIMPREGHPITRGVKPFRINDEWYFKIRFRPDDPRVTPILIARSLVGHDRETYTDQVVGWATERKDGGRAFGFTGAHFHRNWGHADFRKVVLNAILWSAKLEVPPAGVRCDVGSEDLEKNLDPKGRRKDR